MIRLPGRAIPERHVCMQLNKYTGHNRGLQYPPLPFPAPGSPAQYVCTRMVAHPCVRMHACTHAHTHAHTHTHQLKCFVCLNLSYCITLITAHNVREVISTCDCIYSPCSKLTECLWKISFMITLIIFLYREIALLHVRLLSFYSEDSNLRYHNLFLFCF